MAALHSVYCILLQEISYTMRLLTNQLFQLEDKIDIVVTCPILPEVNLTWRLLEAWCQHHCGCVSDNMSVQWQIVKDIASCKT